ncbi:MAG: DUF4625 domain-containing protein [Flavobacteriales bacterium]
MKKVIFLTALVFALASCKKDKEDTTVPVIGSIKVNGAVAEEHELNAGDVISVEITVSDNEELNQLKVNIHGADDGHTHDGSTEGEVDAPNVGVWSNTQIFDLSGTALTQTISYTVPATISGHWHLEVQLIDDQGNEATEAVTTFHIENTNLPILTISSAPEAVDYVIITTAGGTIVLTGTVTDPDGLTDIHVELENESTGDVIWEQELSGVSGNSYDIGTINVGPIAIAGAYHLHVHATDGAGYLGEWSVEVNVE